MKPEDTEELMRSITSEDHIQHVREQGGAKERKRKERIKTRRTGVRNAEKEQRR